MRQGIAVLLLTIAGVGGCQTPEERVAIDDAATSQRLARFQGRTMDEFIAAMPAFSGVDYIDTSAGRTFLFEAVGGALTFPGSYGAPTVQRTFMCRLQIRAQLDGERGLADSWRIVSISHSGACANI